MIQIGAAVASMIYASFALETLCVSVTGRITRAYGQAVEIVIHEYQNAQQEGGQQCAPSCFDCLNCPTTIRRRAACLIHQRNHDTQNNKENQNPHIAAVGKLCQHTGRL